MASGAGDMVQPQGSIVDVLKFHVESKIKHRYARTVITSVVANNAATAQEVFFKITLPESAFISAFQMEIDGKVYKAHVKEKEEAKTEYVNAVALGMSAAHVEQSVRDSSKFSVSVNVEKQKTITFKLTHEELLKRELSAYKHVINIDPGQIIAELLVEVYIEEPCELSLLEVPPLQQSSELKLTPTTEVNELAKIERPKPNEAVVRWSPNAEEQKKFGTKGVRGQLIVRYDIDRKSKPEQILINNGYFVHFYAPADLPVLRKHVVFVLDVSGSMDGRKIEQLKDAMIKILTDLRSNDYFSLIIFSTSVRVWDPNVIEPIMRANEPSPFTPDAFGDLPSAVVVPAIAAMIERAKSFVASLHSDSSTNIHGALLRAIEVAHLGKKLHASEKITGPRPEPMIIFLTDGQPNVGESDPNNITLITTKANNDVKACLFSLAFGEDADMEFLKKLSLRNSGFARRIYEAADAALQLGQFYRLVSSPLLANVQFKYEDGEVVAGSVTNTNFRNLFDGSELVVAGRLNTDAISGEMTSDSCGVKKSTCICKPTVLPKKEHEFMERLWAFLTIKQLLDNVTADTDVVENKKQALQLALKYSFVTPLTSLVVVKPDKSTDETDTKRADVGELDGGRMFTTHARFSSLSNRQMSFPQGGMMLCSAAPQGGLMKKKSSVPHWMKDTADTVVKPMRVNCSKVLSDDLSKSSFPGSPDRMQLDEALNYFDGEGSSPEVAKCKVSSLHVKCNIWCRYACTLLEQVCVNEGNKTEEISFNVYLTWSAVISHCSLSLNGKVKNLLLSSTAAAEQNFTTSKNTGKAAVFVRPSTSDGQRGVTVCVSLPPKTTLTFKVRYEEYLEDFGDGYIYTFILNPGQTVPDLRVLVNVEAFYKLADVRAFNIIPFSPKEGALDQVDVNVNPADNRKATLAWSPSVGEQTKLFGSDRTMQLGVEYKAEKPSFESGGPDGEVVLDESGQTIHINLPSTVSPGTARRHLILLLHIGSSTTKEIKEQIISAARNLLVKLQEKDVFSVIVSSSDIQVWEDSGSVLSGNTTLGTDRFPASQENITKARDFVTQALATVPSTDPSIETALTKALQISIPKEETRPKIFVLSTSEVSMSETEIHAVAARLKKANDHKAAIFSLACGSVPLLVLLRDISADSYGFACELHKQTVERLLDLFFRVSEFDRINFKVVSQLPVFEGFMEKFWLKESIEQSSGDKLKLSLQNNIATSETSYFAASD